MIRAEPRTKTAARAIAAAALLLCALAPAQARPHATRPRWTRAKPHYETRGARRFAVAVGEATDKNIPLARSAAEERARADIARLIGGLPPGADVPKTQVKGAQAVAFYEAGGGRVFVRLELDAGPAAKK